MAGDWLPMRLDLAEDPAVILIATITKLDEFGVVGRLHKLWSWANAHLEFGNAAGVTESWVDRYVCAPGFAAAMVKAGWLEIGEQGLTIPKFDKWNSQGSKRRIVTAKRVARHREKCNAVGNAVGVTPSVTGALPKEEKRREETERQISPVPGERPKRPKSPPKDKTPRPPNPLFDAVAEVTRSDPVVTGAHVGKITALLSRADPPYTPDEVREFGRRFHDLCPWARKDGSHPTLGAIEKYIGAVREAPAGPRSPTREELRERFLRQQEETRRALELGCDMESS